MAAYQSRSALAGNNLQVATNCNNLHVVTNLFVCFKAQANLIKRINSLLRAVDAELTDSQLGMLFEYHFESNK